MHTSVLPPPKRRQSRRYRDCLHWIAWNDDTAWLFQTPRIISTTAALVADVFDRSDAEIIADLDAIMRKIIARQPEAFLNSIEDLDRCKQSA